MKLSPLFISATLLFCANQLLERFVAVPYLHAYLDDLLCPAIVLGAALYFFQWLLADGDFRFTAWQVGFFWAWYSLLFELIFPLNDPRHFSDPFDLLAYALGCVIYWRWGNIKRKST